MFKTTRTAESFDEGAYTLLEKDAAFEGKLTFDGTVQIFGKFKGEIFSSGTLIVGETATVEANIEVGVLQIAGRVQGYLHAKERLELLAKSHVLADINTPALVVEQGSKFQGNCQMGISNEHEEGHPERNTSYLSVQQAAQQAAQHEHSESAIELFQ